MFMTKQMLAYKSGRQRQLIRKEDAVSPTGMGDSAVIISTIEVHERRKVIVIGIGALLNADLDEIIIMLLRGELVELIVAIDPALYRPYMITTARGEKLLYVKMLKAMYGLMRAALSFMLNSTLTWKSMGFK